MKSKFSFSLILLLLLSLGLAACKSANSQATSSQVANGQTAPGQGSDQANAPLGEIDQLAIGTLKLEGSDQAVTAEQAKELLTLWQAYQALGNSDTTAQAELEAVVNQIKGNMTPEQTQAIEAMQITRQTMFEEMQALGIDFGNRGNGEQGGTPQAGQSSSGRAQNGGGFPDGGPGGGAMPGGGGMPGGGMGGGGMEGGGPGGFNGQTTPDATTQARFANQSNRINPMLLQALIEMLESK